MKLKYLIPFKGVTHVLNDPKSSWDTATLIIWYNVTLVCGTIYLLVKVIL